MNKIDDALYFELQRLAAKYQQVNSYVSEPSGFPISLADGHIMVELANSEGRTPSQLAEALLLDRVTISRRLKFLESKNLIYCSTASHDSRSKIIKLTEAGLRMRSEADQIANQNAAAIFDRLSTLEQDRFIFYLEVFLQGLGGCKYPAPPGMHKLRQVVGGITRRRGLLGNNVLKSKGFTSLEWHVVVEVNKQNGTSPSKLCSLFSIKPNTLTYCLIRLEKKGYLTRKYSAKDRRQVQLLPSEKGIQIANKLEQAAADQWRDALQNLNKKQLLDFVELFRKSVDLNSQLLLQPEIRIQKIQELNEQNFARGKILEWSLQHKLQFKMPEHIISKNSQNFALKVGEHIKAIVEIKPEEKNCLINNFLCAIEYTDFDKINYFIIKVLDELFKINPKVKVYYRNEGLPSSIYSILNELANPGTESISKISIEKYNSINQNK